jgi:hypothetical protein
MGLSRISSQTDHQLAGTEEEEREGRGGGRGKVKEGKQRGRKE